MSGTVLCALDISQPEHEAAVLKRAHQIAQIDGARLDVLTVVPNYGTSMVGSFFPEGFHEKAVKEAHDALEAFVSETLGADVDENVRHLVATGTVYEQVLQVAERERATLIVLGSHRPALRDYLLGPNASRVVRHANCSVFVVR